MDRRIGDTNEYGRLETGGEGKRRADEKNPRKMASTERKTKINETC